MTADPADPGTVKRFLESPDVGDTALFLAEEFEMPNGGKFRVSMTSEFVGKSDVCPTGYVVHLGIAGVVTLTFEMTEYRILREVLNRLEL